MTIKYTVFFHWKWLHNRPCYSWNIDGQVLMKWLLLQLKGTIFSEKFSINLSSGASGTISAHMVNAYLRYNAATTYIVSIYKNTNLKFYQRFAMQKILLALLSHNLSQFPLSSFELKWWCVQITTEILELPPDTHYRSAAIGYRFGV